MKIIKKYLFDTLIYTTLKIMLHSVINNVKRMLKNAAFFYKECKDRKERKRAQRSVHSFYKEWKRTQRSERFFKKNGKERKDRSVLL